MAKVLIIEDNEVNAETVRNKLLRSGHEIILAVDGEEGFAKTKNEKPDLIVMDVRMPRLNGIEATKKIRAESETADIPIIAMSGFANEDERRQVREAGCNETIDKPINFKSFNEKVKNLLKGG